MCFKNKKILVAAQFISDLLSEVVSSVSAGGESLLLVCMHLPPDFRLLSHFTDHCSHLFVCEVPSLLLVDLPGPTPPSPRDPVLPPGHLPRIGADFSPKARPIEQQPPRQSLFKEATYLVRVQELLNVCARNICRQVEVLF